jgi:hypothetical protein
MVLRALLRAGAAAISHTTTPSTTTLPTCIITLARPVHHNCKCNIANVQPPKQAQIPEMDPVKMPWQFPLFTDFDRENPGPAFADLEK